VLPDPASAALDAADRLELARLEQLVRAVPLPAPDLPGWQSLTAREYEAAARRLADLLGTIAAALAAARAAG
jgi:hypothetical protein